MLASAPQEPRRPIHQKEDLPPRNKFFGASSNSYKSGGFNHFHSAGWSENTSIPVVKPSDEKEVTKLRNSFIEIAKKEREDSKERDANFMPEVR